MQYVVAVGPFKCIAVLPRLRVTMLPGSITDTEVADRIPHVDMKECVCVKERVIEVEKADPSDLSRNSSPAPCPVLHQRRAESAPG